MTAKAPELEEPSGRAFTPEEAARITAEVRAYLLAQGREQIGGSRFMRRLEAGQMTRAALQKFWLNWHSQVWDINNLICASYHFLTPFFKRNLDLLPLFADKIADELVHPEPPGHMLIVWRQGEIFGLSREQMIHYPLIPECRALMDWHRGLLFEGTMIEYWTAISYEEYTGHWSRAFGSALVGHYGYTREQAPYFRVHEEADLTEHQGIMGHAEFNWRVFQRLLEQGEARFRPGFSVAYCIDTELALRRRLLDACVEF